MLVEEASVEEGDPAQQGGEVWCTLRFRLSETFVEQPQEEEAVELLEAPAAALFLHHLQAVAQVVEVSVEEALLLDEIDEHHSVEHEGGVPVAFVGALADFGDTRDELPEGVQLGPEAVVEVPRDFLDIQRRPDPGCDKGDVQRRLLIQGDEQWLNTLEQVVPACARSDSVDVAEASDLIVELRERKETLEIAAEEARGLLKERRQLLDSADTIATFAEEMSDFLKTSELTETRAFVHSFVKEVQVKPGRAAIIYSMPTPDDSPIGGADAAEIALNGRVMNSVLNGEPQWMVGGTVFEMCLGL